MTHTAVGIGPRLVATATGRLRCAVLVRPNAGIERTGARIGEPGAIYARALEQHEVLRSTLEYFGVETIVLGVARERSLRSECGRCRGSL